MKGAGHTVEPWEVSPLDECAEIRTVAEFVEFIADGSRPKKNVKTYKINICWFSMFAARWGSCGPRRRADARRIVTCVNALSGIPSSVIGSEAFREAVGRFRADLAERSVM